MLEARYFIVATAHNSPSDTSRNNCAVLMDLVPEVDHERNAAAAPFLRLAPSILESVCASAIKEKFSLRFDLPPDFPVPGAWPAVARTGPSATSTVRTLLAWTHEEMLYPFSIWGLAPGYEDETERVIEAFQTLRMDSGLFDEVLALSGFRIAVFRSSITLTIGCQDLGLAKRWVRKSLEGIALTVKWLSE
jgi:hypothetical protein